MGHYVILVENKYTNEWTLAKIVSDAVNEEKAASEVDEGDLSIPRHAVGEVEAYPISAGPGGELKPKQLQKTDLRFM